jgi:hypothetical protein
MVNSGLEPFLPHIELSDSSWIKAMSLFYDRIYRIVPDNVIPEDNSDLQPLLEEGSVGSMINPSEYSKEASEEFLSKIDEWGAAALMHEDNEVDQITRLHNDKTDEQVRALFRQAGFKDENDWLHVPTELASNYMLYLANAISKKNNLSLITSDWGAWTGTTYFSLDGKIDETISPEANPDVSKHPFLLFSLIISEIIPINIHDIPSEDILEFRIKRADEIARFRECIDDLAKELQTLDSDEIKLDVIEDKVKHLKNAKSNYQRSADLIKVKGWCGTSLFKFSAPSALGILKDIPTASTVSLGIAGLAMGVLYNIMNTKEEIRKLNKENPSSYLIEMDRSFKRYTSVRGGGDINYHAYNCMEEYVND